MNDLPDKKEAHISFSLTYLYGWKNSTNTCINNDHFLYIYNHFFQQKASRKHLLDPKKIGIPINIVNSQQ